jgi:hypothetical protein
MKLERRRFMKLLGMTCGAVATAGLLRDSLAGAAFPRLASRPPLDPRTAGVFDDELQTLAALALDEATALGCEYADVRLDRCRRDAGVVESERCVVQVIHAGTWGIALSASLEKREIVRTAARALAAARTHAALGTDPFDVFRQCKEFASAASYCTAETYYTSTKGGHSRALRHFPQREEG